MKMFKIPNLKSIHSVYIYIYVERHTSVFLSLLLEYLHTDSNTYVRLSLYTKYILCMDFKFGILKLNIFMIIMMLCKHYGIP